LGYSRDFTATRNTVAPELGWQSASALSSGTEEGSGSNLRPDTARHSTSPSRGTPDGSGGRRLNVLMVEDNLADALLVREALRAEKLPVEVYAAVDGEQAISFIEKAEDGGGAPTPDMVILDINLPRVDGFEVLRRIRSSARFEKLPVMVVTSSDSPGDRSESARIANAYFRKCPDYDEFLKIGPAIRAMLEKNNLL
jgi:CheY-like chemotaxis protein